MLPERGWVWSMPSRGANNFDGFVAHGHRLRRENVDLPSAPGTEPASRVAPSPHHSVPDGGEVAPTFDQVYAEGFAFVFRVLRSLGVHSHRLEDAAQDVFTVVHRKLGEFDGRSSIRTWLFGIARRVASDYRRSERRKWFGLVALPAELECQRASPHASLEAQRAADFVDDFLKSLSTEKREVFALAFMEEMPAAEVAQALGIPLNTAYSRIRTVRAQLKRALERRKLR